MFAQKNKLDDVMIKEKQAYIWQRLIGWIIDLIIIYMITVPILLLISGGVLTYEEQQSIAFYMIICMFIYSLLLEFIWGKTIGKFIMMTKVITLSSGDKPEFIICFGRSLSRLIPLDPLSYLFSLKPAGWHDKISNTRVIRSKNYYIILFRKSIIYIKKYFHQLFEINKGYLRILLIINSISSVVIAYVMALEAYDIFEFIGILIFLGLFLFLLFWLIVWLLLIALKWVKRGFEDAK